MIDSFFVQMSWMQTIAFAILCCGGPMMYVGYHTAMKHSESRRQVLYMKLIWTGIKAAALQKCEALKERLFGRAKVQSDTQIDLYNTDEQSEMQKKTLLLNSDAYPIMKPANLEDLMN